MSSAVICAMPVASAQFGADLQDSMVGTGGQRAGGCSVRAGDGELLAELGDVVLQHFEPLDVTS